MVDDVGDPEKVNPKKKRWQLEQEQRVEDFKQVVSTQAGRAVMWRLLEHCGIHKSSFQGDIHHMLLNEGKRNIGLEIEIMFDELGVQGEREFSTMTGEAKQRIRKAEGNG